MPGDWIPARIYIFDSKDYEKLKKLMEYDPYLDKSLSEEQLANLKSDAEANIIFARQDYKIKDGISLGLERDKYYLYLSANEEFMQKADAKLKKNLPEIKRAEPEIEKKVIGVIDRETSDAEQGLGSIFGG